MFITLFILGLAGGILSGLLGVGGAIVMIPLSLYIPPLLHLGSFDMKLISGMVMTMVMFASITGVIIHNRNNYFSKELLIYLGLPCLISAGSGAVLSKYMTGDSQLIIFAILTTITAAVLFFHQPGTEEKTNLTTTGDNLINSKQLAITGSAIIGVLVGIVGAGGGFILIPFMTSLLGIPIKFAIGGSLGIVFMSSITGFTGKFVTGQIPLTQTIFLVLGALPGASIGSIISHRLNPNLLKKLLMFLVTAIALRTWLQVWY